MKALIFAVAICSLAIACEKKPSPEASTTAAPATPAATPATSAAATPAAVTVNDEDLSTEEDFEDQAKKEITAKNLDTELDKIDKEIAQ